MRLIYAEYNPQTNSIDVNTYENYILRIDCNKAENGLRTTPCSQNSLNALAIDPCFERFKSFSAVAERKDFSKLNASPVKCPGVLCCTSDIDSDYQS